ncbi:MAG: hypothetical protein ACE5GQ_03595 [Nitrospinales bacterium]
MKCSAQSRQCGRSLFIRGKKIFQAKTIGDNPSLITAVCVAAWFFSISSAYSKTLKTFELNDVSVIHAGSSSILSGGCQLNAPA